MKKSPFIGLVFFATSVVAGSVAAQSPVAVTGEGTGVPDLVGPVVVAGSTTQPRVAVITYQYDNLRTGWNNQETKLTRDNVNQTNFGIINTVPLDDQVDSQPLIVPNQTIAGGTHDVVYVATEGNTIYAIDASNGAMLLSRNLGSPVPKPLGNVGIQSTPIIDVAAQTLYLIAYVNGSPQNYQLHALDLSDLTDKDNSPVTVAASHILTNGSTFTFDATVQRQRPALLETNGHVYAGFGSFGDTKASSTRGWLLGWNASTLKPFTGSQLNDTDATSPTSFFLSSIWMSGYGIAASGHSLYFSTGNSDCNVHAHPVICPAQTTYDGVTNIQESVVRLAADLTHPPLGIFTPSNVADLDKVDHDLGSGGVLLLPEQSGKFPFLAVTGGKDGRLFLLDRKNLGGFTLSGPDNVLDTQQLPACFCGPSFFTGSANIGRVVTSHGFSLSTWQVQLSPSPHLVPEGTVNLASGQENGFLTVVSSHGTRADDTGIIWAVGRPIKTTLVTLFAFAATASGGTLNLLFSSPAGSWAHTGGNANIVPVVANGKVYVATDKQLAIFGLGGTSASQTAVQPSPVGSLASPHEITGTLLALSGSTLTLQTRTGKSVKIDASQAVHNEEVAPLFVGEPFTALGSSLNANGALVATSIVQSKGSSGELWPPDH
jgi:hypothetical protein